MTRARKRAALSCVAVDRAVRTHACEDKAFRFIHSCLIANVHANTRIGPEISQSGHTALWNGGATTATKIVNKSAECGPISKYGVRNIAAKNAMAISFNNRDDHLPFRMIQRKPIPGKQQIA